MYPVGKHTDDVHRGTGVFYQAIPAVGADGEKIMKLVPVQLVKGRCLDSTTHKAVNVSSEPATFKNALSNKASCGSTEPAGLAQSPQQRTERSKVPMSTTPATNCVASLSFPCQRPVMVKSPALPRGQFLRIPPNAHVRTLPAADLPPDIKRQIFNSSASCTPGSDVPSVLFVSPVTTVSQRAPFLKLIPKASHGSNGPTRWVVEEEDTQTGVRPLNPQTVAQRDKSGQHSDVSESEQDNALIMCNGKVFFVAKKCSLLMKHGENPPTEASFHHAAEPPVAPTQPGARIIISDEPDEVIDLCDDDTQDNSQRAASTKESAAAHQDDDNVIFVSYLPPKCESPADLTVTTYTTLETDRDCLTQEQSSGRRADAETGATRASAGTNVHDDDDDDDDDSANVASKQSASTHQAPPPCRVSDRHLSQTFGITADVKICLRRVDTTSTGRAEAQGSEFIISADDQHEPASGSITDGRFDTSCENQSSDVRTVAVSPEQAQPACAIVSALGGSCPEGVSRGAGNTTLIGYVEPIDEDFLCANESAEQTVNTSRMGRARKRTMCPCCVPGALEPALKSVARPEEPEKLACRTEQIGRKGTRTKAARKAVLASGNSCLTVRTNQKSKSHECRAGDSLSTDTDGLCEDRRADPKTQRVSN